MLIVALTSGQLFDDSEQSITVQPYGVRVYDAALDEITIYPWHQVSKVFQRLEPGDDVEI